MAVTLAKYTGPLGSGIKFKLGPFTAQFWTVTGDAASYLAGGYSIPSSSFGMSSVMGAIVIEQWVTASRTTLKECTVHSSTNRKNLLVQLFQDNDAAAYTQRAAPVEAANAFDASTFTCTLLVIGHG